MAWRNWKQLSYPKNGMTFEFVTTLLLIPSNVENVYEKQPMINKYILWVLQLPDLYVDVW